MELVGIDLFGLTAPPAVASYKHHLKRQNKRNCLFSYHYMHRLSISDDQGMSIHSALQRLPPQYFRLYAHIRTWKSF